MKIGILSILPHNTNYGGVLQGFALQKHLKNEGHDAYIIARVANKLNLKQRISFYIKSKLGLVVTGNTDKVFVEESFRYFENTYLQPQTTLLDSNEKMKEVDGYNFDAVIVGSDQVWRKEYNEDRKSNYFLDFVQNKNTKKISYAASFGKDKWEYTDEETAKYSKLLKRFDGISVREESGVTLCDKYLDVKAQHVLDPTLLITKNEYLEIVNAEKEEKSSGELLVYTIHKNIEIDQIVTLVASKLEIKPFLVGRKADEHDPTATLKDRIYPSVANWLKGFDDAKFVVTDSFHGLAFSLIFNKPFLIFANKNTGIARYESLLKIVGLQNRIIYSFNELNTELINEPIDWANVNSVLETKRKESKLFLETNLK